MHWYPFSVTFLSHINKYQPLSDWEKNIVVIYQKEIAVNRNNWINSSTSLNFFFVQLDEKFYINLGKQKHKWASTPKWPLHKGQCHCDLYPEVNALSKWSEQCILQYKFLNAQPILTLNQNTDTKNCTTLP